MKREVVAIALLAATAGACHDDAPTGTAPAASLSAFTLKAKVLPETRHPDASPPDSGIPATDAGLGSVTTFANADPVSGKSIGHTSVVFKLDLGPGLVAAYKPRSKRGPTRYKGEIAAYRLGTALDLRNVPRALPRTFAFTKLLAAVGGESTPAGELLAKEAIKDDRGNVPGALIPWIHDLQFMALEADPLLSEWRGWLAGGDIPEGKKHLARQISTLVVFDYLTGNWDRWSGGNIGYDAAHDNLLFIDNDGAFYEKPPAGPLAAQKERLRGVSQFSRSFVTSLRKLDAKALEAAMGEEEAGVPLLTPKAIAGVVARRTEVLDMIDARIKKAGEAKVLTLE